MRDRLRGDGLTPTIIEAAGPETVPAGGIDYRKIASTQLALSTRQLATLLRSGMPLDQALSAVAEQADDKRVADVFDELRAHIASGESLAAALARWPRTFSDL